MNRHGGANAKKTYKIYSNRNYRIISVVTGMHSAVVCGCACHIFIAQCVKHDLIQVI